MPPITGSLDSNIEIRSATYASGLFPVEQLLSIQRIVVETFTAATGWICPQGVYSVVAECWGAGGWGGSKNHASDLPLAGGGGGAYVRSVLSVVPGTTYSGVVPAFSSFNGPDTWFVSSGTLLAKGGKGCPTNANTATTGGLASESIGDIKFNGGSGAPGVSATYSGAGGAAGGSTGDGISASTYISPSGFGGGGAGGSGSLVNANGYAGEFPGGGGGGARLSTPGIKIGGAGALGKIKLTYAPQSFYMPVSSFSRLEIPKNLIVDTSANTFPVAPESNFTVDLISNFNKTAINAVEQRFGVSYLGVTSIAISGVETVVIAVVPISSENTIYILAKDGSFVAPNRETINIINAANQFFR